ncbi:hypothetical protein PVAP13_4KG024758 [Panicum virgatum]|uniref:Uncharacterized protein n=1 Tax=Panicum virgatum TaxID=38727 RepID=A0A8T0TI39_PANVG|nr:hypothetical protein PVAP13_4KG024758 [Panicum virgatum]
MPPSFSLSSPPLNTVAELRRALPPLRGGHGIGLGNGHPRSILFLSLFRQEDKEDPKAVALRSQSVRQRGATPTLRGGRGRGRFARRGIFFAEEDARSRGWRRRGSEPGLGCAAPLPCLPLFQVYPLTSTKLPQIRCSRFCCSAVHRYLTHLTGL